jgi:hypothetical protein
MFHSHTLQHAVFGCTCDRRNIVRCVICEKCLPPERNEIDSCRGACRKRVLQAQRHADLHGRLP